MSETRSSYAPVKSSELMPVLAQYVEIPANATRVTVTLKASELVRVECEYFPREGKRSSDSDG